MFAASAAVHAAAGDGFLLPVALFLSFNPRLSHSAKVVHIYF